MALQAGSGETADQSKTLDMETLRGKPTVYPTVPIEKWKRRFIVALRAKTMITLDEVINFHAEPELFYGPDETAPLHAINNGVRQRILRTRKRGSTGRRAQHRV